MSNIAVLKDKKQSNFHFILDDVMNYVESKEFRNELPYTWDSSKSAKIITVGTDSNHS